MTLDGKIALVTGASRGIGQAIALELGRSGATVIGTSTSTAGADAIGKQLAAAGVKGTGIALNVNDAQQVESAVQDIQRRFGDIAILVNNAGITRDNLLVRMKDEEWDDIMATDLKSVYRLSKLVLRSMMKARYGRIINMTSVVGVTGNAGQTNYAAAKAGVIGMTRVLAKELARRGVTVNAVAPGVIQTAMLGEVKEEVKAEYLKQIPAGRLGRPEDVANAVLFLASEESSYITGQVLPVTGGWV
jgi:3-oxoacyl-[acyl-carrier protein] reductase